MDTALRLYQRFGLTFLRLTAVPALFCLAAVGYVMFGVLPRLGTTSDPTSLGVQSAELVVTFALALFVGGPLFLLGLGHATATVVAMVSDALVGRLPNPEAAVAGATRVLPRIFVVSMWELLLASSGILVATGMMLLGAFVAERTPDDNLFGTALVIIGGLGLLAGVLIFLAVVARDALAPPVTVIEGLPALRSGRRSRELMKSHGRHGSATSSMWGVYALLAFAYIAITSGLTLMLSLLGVRATLEGLLIDVPFMPVLLSAFDLTPSFLGLWTLIPAWATCITIIYFERRVRLEGYDIESLAQDLNREGRSNRFAI